MKNLLRNKRALSPVIATVILVSVTIVVAVSVAYWLGTIAASYTAFEQIEMPTPYAEYNATLFPGAKQITGEVVGTGDGTTVTFTATLAYPPVEAGTLLVTDGVETFSDDGLGVLTGDAAGTGSIDYQTGVLSVTFAAAPALDTSITGDYFTAEGGWKVYINLKNTGSADATIDNIFLNEKPLNDYPIDNIKLFVSDDTGLPEDLSDISIPVTKGSSEKVIVWIQRGTEGCSSGTRVDLKLHSAGGYNYPAQVKLI